MFAVKHFEDVKQAEILHVLERSLVEGQLIHLDQVAEYSSLVALALSWWSLLAIENLLLHFLVGNKNFGAAVEPHDLVCVYVGLLWLGRESLAN